MFFIIIELVTMQLIIQLFELLVAGTMRWKSYLLKFRTTGAFFVAWWFSLLLWLSLGSRA